MKKTKGAQGIMKYANNLTVINIKPTNFSTPAN